MRSVAERVVMKALPCGVVAGGMAVVSSTGDWRWLTGAFVLTCLACVSVALIASVAACLGGE